MKHCGQTRVRCKRIALILFCFLLSVRETVSKIVKIKTSPCPGTFNYEEAEADDDRWYGDVTLRINSTAEGSSLRITLDRPSELLVSWAGEVISRDNTVYIAYNDDAVLRAGSTYKLRIMAKYDTAKVMPLVKSIHFNSRQICPPDGGTVIDFNNINTATSTSETGDDSYNRPATTSRSTSRTSTYRPTATTHRPTNVNPNNFENPNNFNQGGSNTGSNSNRPNGGTNSWNTGSNNNLGGDEIDSDENGGTNGGGGHVPCGTVSIANPLITNGQKTHHGQWPWHIALYKTEGVNLNYLCGGSLISKNKVITAAHCLVLMPGNRIVSYKSLVVYLGKYNLRQYTGETGVQTKEVSRLNINPTYNSSNFHGDMAILTLSSDVEFTNYVRPVCTWEATNSISEIEDKEGVVAGWGLTERDQTSEELKMATLPVVSTATCLRSYPKFYAEYLTDTAFCAGFRNGTSPCNGDSGGGLVFKRNNNTWYLRGIVSLSVAKEGLNFCNPDYYVIFTDTARYADFIKRNL